MTLTLALAGDTMLGRKVAEALLSGDPPPPVLAPELVELTRAADLFVVNLECCISERGERWADPAKPFFFRAPPVAAEVLAGLGVDAVTLANNHALDYGPVALADTCVHLDRVGIGWVGAGEDAAAARRPLTLEAGGLRVRLIGVSDHPADFAAGEQHPGIAYAPLDSALPRWLPAAVTADGADVVVVTPHWGPNMVAAPVHHVRAAAPALVEAGATLVAGHSAHVFHGVEAHARSAVLYDLGDFVDDYAVDPDLRNDLGLLWFVELDASGPRRIDALPIKLEYCYTTPAEGAEARWIAERFRGACAAMGTDAREEGGRLVVDCR